MAKQIEDDKNWHLANAKSGFLNLKGMPTSCQLSHGKEGWNLRRVKFALWMPVFLLIFFFSSGLLDETFAQDYCASQGNNVSYEWIDKVTIGSFSKVSGTT